MILRGSRVYFGACFAANGIDMQTIKIGLAIRPDERVLSVSSGLPFSCKLLASVPGEAGARAQTYRKLIEREPCGNRRFLAALAVAAVRRGLSVTWTRDFVPSAQEQALVAA